VELYELAVVKRDMNAARKLSYRMLPILEYLEGEGQYTQFVKAACGLSGHSIGPPRRPLLPATDTDSQRLAELLDELRS
jgi:4-hydroxy-tetrahydrodipicolinate synthase